jgi:hypothetical protein
MLKSKHDEASVRKCDEMSVIEMFDDNGIERALAGWFPVELGLTALGSNRAEMQYSRWNLEMSSSNLERLHY